MKRGFANEQFKAEQARMILRMREKGVTQRAIGDTLGITHQRVGQIILQATGKTARQITQEQKMELAKIALPALIRDRERICKGCGMKFIALPLRKFHTVSCGRRYNQLQQTKRPAYKAKLEQLKKERRAKRNNV